MIDRQAQLAKKGSEPAIRIMTAQLFTDAGIRPEIASAFSFNERVVQAELAYRKGGQPGIRENAVITSVNNLTTAVNAPAWARTNQSEVRKLRMLMILRYPHMMASEAPPDEHGRYRALDDTMSPLEASYVAAYMIQQKLLNPEFQFTDSEKPMTAYTDPASQAKTSAQRGAELSRVFYTASAQHSVRDLLHAGDGFFTDLGIAQIGEQAVAK